MNKQEKLNKLGRALVELQFNVLTKQEIITHIKEALYDDLGKNGDVDIDFIPNAVAEFFQDQGLGEEEEVQFYLDNGYDKDEITEMMSVDEPKHPIYWKG